MVINPNIPINLPDSNCTHPIVLYGPMFDDDTYSDINHDILNKGSVFAITLVDDYTELYHN